MEEDQVDVGPPEAVPGFAGLGRRVDQAEVDHLDVGPQLAATAAVALQPLPQPGKLRPIRVQPIPKSPIRSGVVWRRQEVLIVCLPYAGGGISEPATLPAPRDLKEAAACPW